LKSLKKIFIVGLPRSLKEPQMLDTSFVLEPLMLKLAYGGWLATTNADTRLRIAVVGADEEEARALFHASLKRWKEISEATTG
jgi:hypothetical protein